MKFNQHHIAQRILWFVLTVLFLLNGMIVSAAAPKKSKKKSPVFDFRIRLGAFYDDNILKYSDQYLQRFMNREDEGRFHIKTYDDLIILTGLQFTTSFYVFGKYKSQVSLEISRRNYVVNHIKNWNYFMAGVRQYLPGRFSFKIYYSYIPDFYVRHFRDDQWVDVYGYDDPIVFQPFSFAKNYYGVWLQKSIFNNTRIRLSFNYGQYYHNKHYTEYDSKNVYYGIQIWQSIHKTVRLELGYQYITSEAKGYDASYQLPGALNAPDATYAEDRFSGAILWRLPKIKKIRHSLEARFNVMNRYYSSSRPLEYDRLHAGRVDHNLRLYFNYRIKVYKNTEIKLFYNWFGRNSGTSAVANDQFVSNEKSYKQNIIGMAFSYNLRIKTKSRKQYK
jgi:hypothetical protein